MDKSERMIIVLRILPSILSYPVEKLGKIEHNADSVENCFTFTGILKQLLTQHDEQWIC